MAPGRNRAWLSSAASHASSSDAQMSNCVCVRDLGGSGFGGCTLAEGIVLVQVPVRLTVCAT